MSVADAGSAIGATFGSSVESSFDVSVPAGSSLGVDIEGLEVTAVRDRRLGWQVGDKIDQINGATVENRDQATKRVKEAQDANQPITVLAKRLTRSPFVTLEKSLNYVYQESSRPMAESEDMMKKVSELRNLAPFVRDGVFPLTDLKPSLDSLMKDLGAYLSDDAGSPAAPATALKAGSGGEDLGDLFG